MRNLRGIVTAACLLASSVFPASSFSEKETVFNQTYSIQMISDFGEKTIESLRIQADLDDEKDTLYLTTYTQDYDRKNWIGDKKIDLPLPYRYTSINYTFSRMFVLRPQRVKIEELNQRVYTVPKYRWSEQLESYENNETAQIVNETADTIIDKIFSSIPFLNKLYDKFIKNAQEKEDKHYEDIFGEINPDYVYSKISPYIPPNLLIGQTETAREYEIKFDTGNVQDQIPMYVWLKMYLGNPQEAYLGCPPNKRGYLENILVRFNLNMDNVKRDDLYDYFFHGNELKHLNVAKGNIEGTESNPAIITVKNLEMVEKMSYEENKILRIGKAEYVLQEIKDSTEKDVYFDIMQFETSQDREDFMQKQKQKMSYPAFFKEGIFSFVEKPTIEDVLNPQEKFNEEQISYYYDLILNYSNRTGMQLILSPIEKENEELLKAIKEYQMKTEGN